MYRIKRILRTLKLGFHKEIYFAFRLSSPKPSIKPISGLVVKSLDLNNLQDISQIWKVDMRQVVERISSGESECFISYLYQKPVAYHWVQWEGRHFIQKAGKYMILSYECAMIYHTRVSSDFQGRGINIMVMSLIIGKAQEKGLRQINIYTGMENLAQQKSLKKLGFKKQECFKSFFVGKRHFFIGRC